MQKIDIERLQGQGFEYSKAVKKAYLENLEVIKNLTLHIEFLEKRLEQALQERENNAG